MTTRSPSNSQLLYTKSSNDLIQNGGSLSSSLAGQPVHMYCSTCDKQGSRHFHWAICGAEIGAICSLFSMSMSSLRVTPLLELRTMANDSLHLRSHVDRCHGRQWNTGMMPFSVPSVGSGLMLVVEWPCSR